MENKKIMYFGFIMICLATALACGAQTPTNLVLDYDLIHIDSSLRAGDSGILHFVIRNEGEQNAEKVSVWVQGGEDIHVSKRFYLGSMLPDETATISTRLDVTEDASTGLYVLPLHVMYTGYDSEGRKEEYQERIYEIPFIVYGDPLFQVTPLKTTYFKDNLAELKLEGLTMDHVNDLEATLSSSCTNIIGSSRKYVGDVYANQKFNLTYTLKPSSSGACVVFVCLSYTDESGNRVSDNVSIGLNIEETGIDFKIVDINYKPTGPGETVAIKIGLKNVGQADAEDTTLSLSLSDPFTPADTSEKYVGTLTGGQNVDVEFNLAVGWDAETKVYSIPLNISYNVGGTSYSTKKNIGIDISGKIILEVINVESSKGSLRIEVANLGTRAAEGVKATLLTDIKTPALTPSAAGQMTDKRKTGDFNRTSDLSGGLMNQSGQTQYLVSYKSDIKPSKQTTFTFDTVLSGPATLILEYAGLNNERITQTEKITVQGIDKTAFSSDMKRSGTSLFQYMLYSIFVLILIYVAYKLYLRRRSN